MKRRIPSLDGLRAASICLVLLGHLNGTEGYSTRFHLPFAGSFPHFGVQVFFVISGFLITTLLLKEEKATGRIDFRGFYRRRAFRIFPAAICYTMIVSIVWAAFGHPFQTRYIAAALTYLTCYTNKGPWQLGHLWSLSVEEQFYLLWPLAFALPNRKATCWAVMILSPIARLLYVSHDPHAVVYAFPSVADSLAAGCLLALYSPRLPRWMYGLPFTLLACIAAMTSERHLTTHTPLVWGIIPMLIALCIHILIERKDWILNNVPVMYVGTLSYSLYLCQEPFLDQFSPHWWTSFPPNLVLTVVAALAMHYGIEQPMLRIGHGTGRKPSDVKAVHAI